jgi:hypothetical protein
VALVLLVLMESVAVQAVQVVLVHPLIHLGVQQPLVDKTPVELIIMLAVAVAVQTVQAVQVV